MKQLTIANILFERYVNLHTDQQLAPYIDEIWDMLQKSYASIGGFKSAKSKEDLINKTGLAKLVRRDGKIVAVKIYKDELGRKSIAAGTDGSMQGKEGLMKMSQEDIKMNRAWGEFSGAMEHIMIKKGGVPIPNTLVSDILGKPIESLDPDGYHYTREIQGELHKKIMIGDVNKLLNLLQNKN